MIMISSSGCVLFEREVVVPDIISIGECERGVVTDVNLQYVQDLWPQAQVADVLITGGCYQEHMIKKR